METFEALMTRRSGSKMSDRVPDRATVQRLLDAATRAPCHHLSQPWRFVVLTDDALNDFGDAWARGTERQGKDTSVIRDKARRSPVIICVLENPRLGNPKVVELEEHHATGAAMQNILLAAHDLGLAAALRTGPAAAMPEVKEFLELDEGELIAGFIYLGYPVDVPDERPMTRRTPAEQITTWKGWE